MAPEIQAVAHATQAWLKSSWHVQVPFAWLEACVEWLQEEAGGAGRLSQQQINQQALDQWLLTDLRHLSYPVLPEGLSQAQKTALSGTFCVQVDSLLDISQPAYSQMQKWRGSDCGNDEVSAVTQFTQRAWETRPTRMLLLQVTDGVQSLEAMEYQTVPELSTALRPGVKLQLQGQMVCRLGMLLLGPSNIKVLGGEVEDLVERNNQGKVLCRTLGLPEEQQEGGEPTEPLRGNQEVEDLELNDAELLASLEAQEEVERFQVGPVPDSGYGTLSEPYSQSSRSSSIRSLFSTASSRNEASARSYRSGSAQSNRGGSVQGHHHGTEQEDPELSTHQQISDHNMAVEDFPDEDFDDLPLDELDNVIFQQSNNVSTQSASSHRSTLQSSDRRTGNPNKATKAQTAQFEQHSLNGSGSRLGSSNSRSTPPKRDNQGCIIEAVGPVLSPAAASHELGVVSNEENDVMDDDMDCLLAEVETRWIEGSNELPVQQGASRDRESFTNKTATSGSSRRVTSDSSRSATERFSIESSHNTPQGQHLNPNIADFESIQINQQSDSLVPALTLTSKPFTYLCLLEEMTSKPQPHTTEIRVKAFIVTLVGKLSSNNGLWRVCATISDGTGYLDVELSDVVLTGLLGFSVAGKAALKRDPARRGELDTGMRRCQEELVDMCCVMTIALQPDGRKALVTKADPVNEKVFQELEQRRRDTKK